MVNNSLNSSQRGRRASSVRPHGFYSQESTDDQDDVSLDPSDEDIVNNEEDVLDAIHENTPDDPGQANVIYEADKTNTAGIGIDGLQFGDLEVAKRLQEQLDDPNNNQTEHQRWFSKMTIIAYNYVHDIKNALLEANLPVDLRDHLTEAQHKKAEEIALSINNKHDIFRKFLYHDGVDETFDKNKKDAADLNSNIKNSREKPYARARKLANMGKLSKCMDVLSGKNNFVSATKDNIEGLFITPNSNSQENKNFESEYDAINPDICLDYIDLKELASTLNCNSDAKGPSNMTNAQLVSLINDPDETILHLITYLVNWIIRGYLSDEDWNLVNMTKGILLSKSNHSEDNPQVRPISISEPLMMLADRYVKKVLSKKLIEASGPEQIGLVSNGMHTCNRLLQSLFEHEIETENTNIITVKLDIKNAFNSLDRPTMVSHLSKLNIGFKNYWKRLYSVDSIVKFFELDDDIIMQTGTHQGRCTSSLFFDAVLMSILVDKGIMKYIKDPETLTAFLRLLHDDMLIKGSLTEIQNLIELITTAFTDAGLKFNKSKTEVFHHSKINQEVKKNLKAWANEFHDDIKLKEDGLIFGGLPFGTDDFITETLKNKFESFNTLIENIKAHNNIAEIDVGVTLSLCRYCLSTKWMHWLRVIPARLWKYEVTLDGETSDGETRFIEIDIRDKIDMKIWSYFLRDLDISSYKKSNNNSEINNLSEEEEGLAKQAFFLNTRNSGYGVQSLKSISDIAFIGSWSPIMNDVYTQFAEATKLVNTNTDDKIYNALIVLPCIQDIQKTSITLNNICSDIDLDELKKCNPGTGDSGHFDLIHDTLKRFSTSCGLKNDENDFRKSRIKDRFQMKMNHFFLWLKANDIALKLLKLNEAPDRTLKEFKVHVSSQFKFLMFQTFRGRMQRRYLNFTHRSDLRREMNKNEIRQLLTKDLFISPYEENEFICNHCDLRENIQWLTHVETCKFSRATVSSIDRYKAAPVNRSTAIHCLLKHIFKFQLGRGSDMEIDAPKEPLMDRYYLRKNGVQPPQDDPNYRADIALKCNFSDANRTFPIIFYCLDITSGSIHVKSNKDKFLKWSCDKVTKEWSYTWVNNAVAKDLYKDKIKKYSLWDHNNCIIPMAFDSSGNIAPKSKSFINKLYATSTGENGSHVQRNWNSETQRRYLKKNFLDSISLLFAKFRVKDIQNMEKVPLQHRLDQEAARDPHEQERRRRLEEERVRVETRESIEFFLHDREIATRAREEIMNNNTAMVDSQQLQLHQQQQLHELQKTAINAQGIDCDDLQHFTTNLQITNTINDFSF